MWCRDENWFTQLDFASKNIDKENTATEIDSKWTLSQNFGT